MQAFVQALDVNDGRVLMKRELNLHGDNDEDWRRAGGFIVDQISSGIELGAGG